MRAVVVVALLAGCVDGASADLGLSDQLRIPGAQYRPGAFPASTGGPPTESFDLGQPVVVRGDTRNTLQGIFALEAHAAIFGVIGTDGAWIVPTSSPDIINPMATQIATGYAVTRDLPLGPFAVQVAAVDADGHIGDPRAADAVAFDTPPPTGTLVVSLEWEGDADLDLHVVDPLGGEAYYADPNTYQATPGVFDPTGWMTGGILDHDGNASCRRDTDPNEHVAWTMPPPSGAYTIRVDVHDLCGAPSAAFAVSAYTNVGADGSGTLLGARRGILVPDDVSLEQHERGAGVLALQFALP